MSDDQTIEQLFEAAQRNLLEQLASVTDGGKAERWASAYADLTASRPPRKSQRTERTGGVWT